MIRRRWLPGLVFALALSPAIVRAQTPAAAQVPPAPRTATPARDSATPPPPPGDPITASPGPSFEIASVKPSADRTPLTLQIQPGGRFVGTHQTARSLLVLAFGTNALLTPGELTGAPNWANTSSFDIDARAAVADLPPGYVQTSRQLPALIRSLLIDRFKMQWHKETRQQPIYNLVKTTSGAELGSGLRRSTVDCNVPDSRCGTTLVYSGLPRLTAIGATMQQVATMLPRGGLDRGVRDVTGLDGRFDFVLRWSHAQDQPGDPRWAVADVPPQFDVPLFTAIRDQLGLRLESATGPVEVVVIDHLEMPTPN